MDKINFFNFLEKKIKNNRLNSFLIKKNLLCIFLEKKLSEIFVKT